MSLVQQIWGLIGLMRGRSHGVALIRAALKRFQENAKGAKDAKDANLSILCVSCASCAFCVKKKYLFSTANYWDKRI